MIVSKWVCVSAGIYLPHCAHGGQETSGVHPPSACLKVSLLLTMAYAKLAGLPAAADSPVPASHRATGALGLQTHATVSGFFKWAQGFRLKSSLLFPRCVPLHLACIVILL